MATFLELYTEVTDIIQDTSFTSTKLKGYVNRALREICGTVPVPLPSLETTATVLTVASTAYAAMPATYQRDLGLYIYSTARMGEIKVLPHLSALSALYPTLAEAGTIEYASLVGDNLWYQPIPGEVDTLRLPFFQFPTALSADGDIPSCLPVHLHEKLLVNKSCEYAYSIIEDALEGPKLNTKYYDDEYQKGFAELVQWIGPRRRRPVPINDIMSTSLSGVVFHSDLFG